MNLIRNFRRLKSLAVFSISSGLIFAIFAGHSARGQHQQQQQQQAEQNIQDPQKTKPAPEPKEEIFRFNSNLVAVPVSVTDVEGNPVRNLTVEDFQIEEEGVQQQLEPLGEPGKTPLEMALLFDVSRSVRNRFDFEK